MSGVLVVLEDREGRVTRLSWEAAAAARRLAGPDTVSAVVLGAQTEALAAEAAALGVARILRVEHALLAPYTADGFTAALEQLIRARSPAFVVFPHSYQVRDYAPALACRFGQVLISDVIAIGDGPTFTRQLMQGRLNGAYRHAGNGPCFVSVQAGAFRAEAGESPATSANHETFSPALEPARIRTRPGQPFRGTAQTVDLASAQRIVSVGRGIQEIGRAHV